MLVLLVVPWINPFASGPSPAVMSWLVAAVCAVLLWTVPGRIDPDLMAHSLLGAALVSAVMGIMQYFGWADALSPWVNSPGAGQAFGNLRQRNQLASLLGMGLAALLYLDGRRPLRWLGWLMMALLAVGMACSASRTGLVQWILVLLLVLHWRRTVLRLALIFSGAVALIYGAAVLLMPMLLRAGIGAEGASVFGRIASETVDCSSRITLWTNVLHLIAQRPWTGWGLGELDYAHYITLYPGARFCDILDNAHNLPLHVAVEWGLPAASALCALLVWAVLRARPWADASPDRQMAWTVLAILAVHSLLEYPLWYGPFQIAAIWCGWHLWRTAGAQNGVGADPGARKLSMLASPASDALPDGATVGQSSWASPRLAIGLAALLACGYGAWDYYRISQMYTPPEQRSDRYRVDTLEKVKGSILFRSQVQFAELATTALTRANAQRVHELSLELLHFSPEARVVERLIESATLLGLRDEALFHLARYRRAFPEEHAQWSGRLAQRALRRAASAPQGGTASASNPTGP